MKNFLLLTVMIGIASCTTPTSRLHYPETRKDTVVDTFFQTPVEDPYRWLEDDNSVETAQWVEKQNEVTFAYLNGLPGRDSIKARLTELMDYPRISAPYKRAGKYFFSKNDGLQNQSVLFMADSLKGVPRVLLDPNTLSADGTVALAGTEITRDGKYLIYRISRSDRTGRKFSSKTSLQAKYFPIISSGLNFQGLRGTTEGFITVVTTSPGKGVPSPRPTKTRW